MKMFGYVYLTTNRVNGKMYIGQSKGVFDPKYFGSGCLIVRALRKYGKQNFRVKVVTEGRSRRHLSFLEKKFIQQYREKYGRDRIYNLTDGGFDGTDGYVFTDEQLKNLSAGHLGQPAWNKGIPRDEATRRKISAKLKGTPPPNAGKPHSSKTRQRISVARKRWFETHEHPRGMLGKKHSAETRTRMRAARLRHLRSVTAEQENVNADIANG